MPIFEYVCEGCDSQFEKYVRVSGESVSCPECQGQQVEKQFSTFAFTGTGGAGRASAGSSCGGCRPSASCAGCHR
jgi:putative FmdB family regulatory protein